MQTIKSHAYLSAPRLRSFATGADPKSPGYSPSMGETQRARTADLGWQTIITQTLLPWLQNPSQLEDDGIDAPSGAILRLSLDVAEFCKGNRLPSPDRIVPDPNGGIVFERREGDVSEVIHVWDDGAVEYMVFEGARLVDRSPFWTGP